MALTEAWLKAQLNKPREVVEEHADRDSMSVRISTKGKITFQLRYRYNKKGQRLDLGSYPNLSLKEARIAADGYRASLEQGYDPKQVKAEKVSAIQEAYTFKKLFDEWYVRYCEPNKSQHQDIKRSFEIHVFPKLGKRICDSITSNEWFTLLEDIAKDTPSIAERILSNTKQCLKWGRTRHLVTINHLADITAKQDLSIEQNIGDRVLKNYEIFHIFNAIEKSKISYKKKLMFRLLIIFGCRVGELRLAKKEDFDLKENTWTVPASNHKAGRRSNKPLIRPISDNARPYVLQALSISDSEYLFPNVKTGGRTSKSTHSSAVERIGIWLKKHKDIELESWSVHDLRRTMRTNISDFTEFNIAETMIGHILPKVTRTYDKYYYLRHQEKSYAEWVNRLEAIWRGEMLEN